MSFLITCGKCGNEVNFYNKDSRLGDKIQIIPDVVSDWRDGSYQILGVDIYCENIECRHEVELK